MRAQDWPGWVNARTLGGLACAGGSVRDRAFYRSDAGGYYVPAPHAEQTVEQAGIVRIIDLRGEAEAAYYPIATDRLPGAERHPLIAEAVDADVAPVNSHGEAYSRWLDNRPGAIADAVAAIARAPEGAVLVHCAAGKDRTGVVVALVLEVLGVDREDIVEDYAMTGPNLLPYYDAWIAGIDDDTDRAHQRRMGLAPASAMETFLDAVADHGGAEAYLLDSGLTSDDVDALRERLVAPATTSRGWPSWRGIIETAARRARRPKPPPAVSAAILDDDTDDPTAPGATDEPTGDAGDIEAERA